MSSCIDGQCRRRRRKEEEEEEEEEEEGKKRFTHGQKRVPSQAFTRCSSPIVLSRPDTNTTFSTEMP